MSHITGCLTATSTAGPRPLTVRVPVPRFDLTSTRAAATTAWHLGRPASGRPPPATPSPEAHFPTRPHRSVVRIHGGFPAR